MRTGALHYLIGDATDPARDRPTIIAHIVNDANAFGTGFVVAIDRRWPKVKKFYHGSAVGRVLGSVSLIEVEPSLWVANMCAQHGFPSRQRPVALDYHALGQCLDDLAAHATGKRAVVVGPRFGSGIAGGRWEMIEALIKQRLCSSGIDVTIYDLPEQQETRP